MTGIFQVTDTKNLTCYNKNMKINSPSDLLGYMQTIDYGYIDLQGNMHAEPDENFSDQYRLRSHDDVETSKIGVCWDQVEVERHYFNKFGAVFKTYSIVYYGPDSLPNHTFLVYFSDKKVYWFENSYAKYRGIHKYDNIESLVCDVKHKFVADLQQVVDEHRLCLYEYSEPKVGMNCNQFYKHFEKSGPLELLWAK